ncbi:HlyD family secretion protein [Saccharicrinis sp. FJH62]|uniref:HlyD family secretion protein n=1 Tax=Saccharicrinis sp. FJH62 TaxID=3344657 RepID=UPI0035D4640F
MKNRIHNLFMLSWMIGLSVMLASCNGDSDRADAYGNFEAVETIVSSKSTGEIMAMYHNEGETVKAGDLLLQVDTTDLVLQMKQLLAQKNSVLANRAQVKASMSVLEENISGAETEKNRVENLYKDGAATQKQKDDVENRINVLYRQRGVYKANLLSIDEQAMVFDAQMKVLDKKISDCTVTAPVDGTILERYVEKGELAVAGKPLFKLADISNIHLRVYVSGQQLEAVKLGRKVNVKIDAIDGAMKNYEGTVIWVSSEAEFTPKVVQTKKERVKQVYATKVRVKNDGSIKIGMPGEMYFQ